MVPVSRHSLHSQHSVVVGHPLEGLLVRLGSSDSVEREAFELLWRQLRRHAPLFGYADHPDVDDDHLEQVHAAIHEQLVDWAQRGDRRAVEQRAVQAMFGALRSARGLAGESLQPELAALLEPASARLRMAVDCPYIPMAELVCYHRSLERHYVVHQECFEELIDWCVAAIREGSSDAARRFIETMRALPPPRPAIVSNPDPRPVALELRAEGRGLVEALVFRASSPRHSPSEVFITEPPAPREAQSSADLAFTSPVSLAEFAAVTAPEYDAESGSGHPLTQHWYAQLSAALPDIGNDAAAMDQPKRLPALIEHALLVHLLGLDDRRRKAVLSAAADRLIVHRLVPAAREVGAKHNRHEPVAVLLVSVIATALRPWSFVAPELTTTERVILLALLGELATAKSRKLLHQEKQHADSHREPEVIRAAVNRALSRWPERVHAVSPKQRIDRVAAGFRCLNRLRRGVDPRARDLEIVRELVR
jgi:hypothetical protein